MTYGGMVCYPSGEYAHPQNTEYSEYIHKFIGGKCPTVNFNESKKNMNSVLEIIENELIKSVHDCSKGGIAVALSELCITNQMGCNVSLEKIPGEKPCSTCDKNSDFFFWDSSTLTMTWECPDGHKNSFRIQ